MSAKHVFRVRVRHNLVCQIGPAHDASAVHIPPTKLDVSTQLASAHQARGCIDGDYSANSATARYFAFLCQDFVKKLVERTVTELEEARFLPDDLPWRNSHISSSAQTDDA